MSFPLYIAGRYTISRSKSTAVNIITRIAVLGILVSSAALFIIMSVFSGLKDFSLSFSNDTDPDLKVFPSKGKSFMVSPAQLSEIKKTEGVAAYTFIAEERVLFYYNGKEQVAYMKGVDSLYNKVTSMNDPKRLLGGEWLAPHTNQVVVGGGIFHRLSLGLLNLNHALEVYVPKPGKGAIDSPEEGFNTEELVVMGVYSVNEDIDNKYVFCTLSLAQDMLQFKPNQYTGIELKMKPGASESAIRGELAKVFLGKVDIKNRAQLNDSLYKMLNAENLVTYLFCTLVVVLTLFCLAGALIMLILDKQENIRTLHSLGAEVSSLRNIFFIQGVFITGIGAIFGLIIGVLVVWLQQEFNLVMITQTMAYPTAFTMTNVVVVLATIFILGVIASRIAASRVSTSLLES
ncbi:ABC transporter permease [Flavobacterium sp. RHBU_3]|uniref:ABC transporter permease n=1 Tax=Flavobacterium sp. RHBU_3 TaxID=3391184 RepID=UPI0039852E77